MQTPMLQLMLNMHGIHSGLPQVSNHYMTRDLLIQIALAAFFFLLPYVVEDIPEWLGVGLSVLMGLIIIVGLMLKRSRSWKDGRTDSRESSPPTPDTAFNGSVIFNAGDMQNVRINIVAGMPEHQSVLSEAEKPPATPPAMPVELPPEVDSSEIDEVTKSFRTRHKEALSMIEMFQLSEARAALHELLAEVDQLPRDSKRQRAKILNSLGVSYNFPQPMGVPNEAVRFFNKAVDTDPTILLPRINAAVALVGYDDPDQIKAGYDKMMAIWKSVDNKTALDPTELRALIGGAMWTTYRHKGAQQATDFVDALAGKLKIAFDGYWQLLTTFSEILIESGDVLRALEVAKLSHNLDPDIAETNLALANAIVANQIATASVEESPEDFVPVPPDAPAVEQALHFLDRAKQLADDQNKSHLIQNLLFRRAQTLVLLRQFGDALTQLNELARQSLSDEMQHQFDVLKFTTQINNREFDEALAVLQSDIRRDQVTVREQISLAGKFLWRGGVEQANALLSGLTTNSIASTDPFYWLQVSIVAVLAADEQRAIDAVNRARHLASNASVPDHLKIAVLQHYGAVAFRYAKTTGKDTGDRLISAMAEIQQHFPDEDVVRSVQALDETGEITPEMKGLMISQRDNYIRTRQTFTTEPIPTSVFAKQTGQSYASFICTRDDPMYRVEFSIPGSDFVADMERVYADANSIVFDYMVLLDLSATGLLPALERLEKKILIHSLVLETAQKELLQDEIHDLRVLWEFLRKSKSIQWVSSRSPSSVPLEPEETLLFDDWLLASLEAARTCSAPLMTNDLRLIRYLKTKQILAINIIPLLLAYEKSVNIERPEHSKILGTLASRFYTFLAFNEDQLSDIAFQDDYRLTARLFHLMHQIALPGSNRASFVNVFVRFVAKLWKAAVPEVFQLEWLIHVTNALLLNIDRKSQLPDETRSELEFVWSNAVDAAGPLLRGFFRTHAEEYSKKISNDVAARLFIKTFCDEDGQAK